MSFSCDLANSSPTASSYFFSLYVKTQRLLGEKFFSIGARVENQRPVRGTISHALNPFQSKIVLISQVKTKRKLEKQL